MPLALTILWLAWVAGAQSDYREGSLAKQGPQSIYAADPGDAWNRIFYLLFTRKVDLRVTDDFEEQGPFAPVSTMGNPSLPVSSRTLQRIEGGDRAIDPLYPSFFTSKGAESVLVDPTFTELKQALKDALGEATLRPPLNRALMQADIWAAYDILARLRYTKGQLGDRARELLPLLDQFIAKQALTSQEIAALPRNYPAAQRSESLPAVFDKNSGWMEVEWFPYRLHEAGADDRRAVRVFLKPTVRPRQFLAEVNEQVRRREDPLPDPPRSLDEAVLVTEDLLIDSQGRVVPSPLTYEVQLRTFVKDAQGKLKETTLVQYELSRRLLLANPSSGGFNRVSSDQPAYMPSSGNDYSFASPTLGDKSPGPPILGTLRRRCQSCHGEDATSLFTFQMIPDPRKAPPSIRQLGSDDDPHASYVAKEKMKQPNFKSLRTPR